MEVTMTEIERVLEAFHALHTGMFPTSPTEQRIARCKRVLSLAHDPEVKAIWKDKIRKLQEQRMGEAN